MGREKGGGSPMGSTLRDEGAALGRIIACRFSRALTDELKVHLKP